MTERLDQSSADQTSVRENLTEDAVVALLNALALIYVEDGFPEQNNGEKIEDEQQDEK